MDLQELAAAYSEQLILSKINSHFSREQVIEHLLKRSENSLLLEPVQHEAIMQLRIHGHETEKYHDFNLCCRSRLLYLYEDPLRKIKSEEAGLINLFVSPQVGLA